METMPNQKPIDIKESDINTVDFKDVANDWDSVGNISDIRDEPLKLVSFELVQDSKNEVGLIQLIRQDGTPEKRHTFSTVLIKQLKQMENILRTKRVNATVTKRKNYYTFQ